LSDELEQVQSELLLAKNELQLLEVSVPKEDAPVPANGNEQEVVSEPVWLTSESGR
jgi:hypothetical protein